MKVLILGSGGREHAMAWKVAQSKLANAIYCLPGNDGMTFIEKVSKIPGSVSDIPLIVSKAKELSIDLVIVGPEDPLSLGVTDALEKEGIKVFGPSKEAAKLEASKVFSKNFMLENDIPTAKSFSCDSYESAMKVLDSWDFNSGVVIKADELAAGKGVVVTSSEAEARKTLFDFMKNPDCTVKASKVLIEEKLSGKEVSAFAICDGENFISLGYACDYKRVGDKDQGPNTGGMGGYSPKNWPEDATKKFIEERVFKRVLQGMSRRGFPYKGFLFAGLMIDGPSVKVIEFNVRMGDPETQILLPLVEGDLVPTLFAAAKGEITKLGNSAISLRSETSVHIVMTSKGYPSIDGTQMLLNQPISYPVGLIPGEEGIDFSDKFLFLAGAKKNKDQVLVNSGGRVLGVTAIGSDLKEARESAYAILSQISFDGAHFRRDIGL
jgi:phosphoribosylamine--glycine ligase